MRERGHRFADGADDDLVDDLIDDFEDDDDDDEDIDEDDVDAEARDFYEEHAA